MTLGITTRRASCDRETAYQVSRPSAAPHTQISQTTIHVVSSRTSGFGPEEAALWLGRLSRYHIEVKSARGEDEEPFHMSHA
jgi:hypothetical protein